MLSGMDEKRIGGGLLAAAGVLFPAVTQMMGLQLNPIIGGLLLLACAALVVSGLVLLFTPSKKKETKPQAPPPPLSPTQSSSAMLRADDQAESVTLRVKGSKISGFGHAVVSGAKRTEVDIDDSEITGLERPPSGDTDAKS